MIVKIAAVLFSVAMISPISAGEREILLKTFAAETAEAEKSFQAAMSTIELTGEAGHLWDVAEKQCLKALDYKLRHTEDPHARLTILKNFHLLSREVQKICDTPRENRGSLIGMHIYHHIAILFRQQTAILLLDNEKEELWHLIADSTLLLNGQELRLEQGKTGFTSKMHGEKVTLELILFPEDTFRFRGHDFAVVRTDIRFAGNDDFSSVYLFELKKGKLQVHTRCQFSSIKKWELNGDFLMFHSEKDTQKIKLL